MTDDLTKLPRGVQHLRCANPGPMTLTGTNTYVVDLREGGRDLVGVIDPGPDDAAHREATVAAVVEALGGAGHPTRVLLLLTHHHDDHEGGAGALVTALRERGLTVDRRGGAQGNALADGELIGDLQVVHVPGHTRDSVAFLLERDGAGVLFSGDTVLGEGSSFVAYPDGDLTAYLASLDVLAALVPEAGRVVLAPGHGPIGADAAPAVGRYAAHRQERLDEVRLALRRIDGMDGVVGDALVTAVADEVYRGVEPQLRPAVEAVVTAQLAHLGRL